MQIWGDEIKKNLKKLKKNLKKSSLKLLSQSQTYFAEMILGWSPFKIVSVSAVLYPRWLPLLKIEISSNGQNCSILSQKVPKGVGVIRVDFGPISETVYIDIILNTIIER